MRETLDAVALGLGSSLRRMFTGIVRERGRVASFDGGRLVLETSVQAAVGDSIAVDGVCLTVVSGDEATLAFDVVPETLARSTLGAVQAGDARQRRARAAPRRRARRPHRAGSRRRRRPRAFERARGRRAAHVDRGPAGRAAHVRREGVDHRVRRLAHDRGARPTMRSPSRSSRTRSRRRRSATSRPATT